ncbi:hypothetical protein [Croceivirga thetidis]|uniref:Uncharacterized protein n=1 Tax=Croceivirga thetidis TaxID=2721623 RepID=A0ABX1GTP7_9FLAO|nr:hypothetical protein [Croceivirga thetidis]NKI32097.1 hypothetical protein [Croceivirga thetidis]
MAKKYSLFLITLHIVFSIHSQVVETLRLSDFDLKGNVKSCMVLTDYGKELLEFDKKGRLEKIVTQYNENDQDITQFKYLDGILVEKRLESYKNGKLDLQTSMANFYEFDTISESKRVVEKIISYDKAFFEEQEFFLNDNDKVEKIITSHGDGVDEKQIEYSDFKGEQTTTTFLNGVIENSIRKSKKKMKNGEESIFELTKDFVDGEPEKAIEKQYNASGNLISEEFFDYDIEKKQFVSTEKRIMKYSKEGVLEKEVVLRGNATSERFFIFQFDNNEERNWVKKITTPENSYTTRRIIYYKSEDVFAKTMN